MLGRVNQKLPDRNIRYQIGEDGKVTVSAKAVSLNDYGKQAWHRLYSKMNRAFSIVVSRQFWPDSQSEFSTMIKLE